MNSSKSWAPRIVLSTDPEPIVYIAAALPARASRRTSWRCDAVWSARWCFRAASSAPASTRSASFRSATILARDLRRDSIREATWAGAADDPADASTIGLADSAVTKTATNTPSLSLLTAHLPV
jgi:hypothetical protein